VLILAVLTACLVGLRSRRPFSLLQLRGIELVVFGAVVTQVSLMWDQHQEVAESSLDLKREPVDATIELTLDETTQRGI
jgi:hypothetical protein